jgi:hypothetical protein
MDTRVKRKHPVEAFPLDPWWWNYSYVDGGAVAGRAGLEKSGIWIILGHGIPYIRKFWLRQRKMEAAIGPWNYDIRLCLICIFISELVILVQAVHYSFTINLISVLFTWHVTYCKKYQHSRNVLPTRRSVNIHVACYRLKITNIHVTCYRFRVTNIHVSCYRLVKRTQIHVTCYRL